MVRVVSAVAAGLGPAAAGLPPLREELTLHAGPRGRDGAPSWTLEDPATNRFFRIGWLEFEVLTRWNLGTPEAIAAAVEKETTLNPVPAQVEAFAKFLSAANLLQVQGAAAMARLVQQAQAGRHGLWYWLLKNYLFLRVPLFRPDRFLAVVYPWIAWVYRPWFLVFAAGSALIGGWLAVRRWEEFVNTFLHFFSLEGIILSAVALTGAKILHELGHAFTAHRHGCRVASMGVAFLVLWPVLYTDTSGAWRLPRREPRLAIGAAGMAAELILAAFATVAWSFLPDGPLRSVAFLLATSTWLLTLMINLNPFMRFDGYYLLSDWLEVPNLQERSFAYARWRLREFLFGLGDPPPETFPPRLTGGLLVYAYLTWLYRLVLFFGIAILVYHLFFKALGLVLFAVEIWWFLLRPILRELRGWAARSGALRTRRGAITATLGAGLLFALLIPWQSAVQVPAMARAAQQTQLFVPLPGRLAEVRVQLGDRVAAGATLFRFEAPDLAHELAQAERSSAILAGQAQIQSLTDDVNVRSPLVWSELAAAQAKAFAFRHEAGRLTVTAPFEGLVAELAEPLLPGEWLERDQPLATVIDDRTAVIEAYLLEADLHRLSVGAEGRFYPEDIGRPPILVRVTAIDRASTRSLTEPYLASVYGGAIAVRVDAAGNLVPENPIYRVLLAPEPGVPAPARVERGSALLEGARESYAARFLRDAVALLIRESGF